VFEYKEVSNISEPKRDEVIGRLDITPSLIRFTKYNSSEQFQEFEMSKTRSMHERDEEYTQAFGRNDTIR
jgi:hypothetical protein